MDQPIQAELIPSPQPAPAAPQPAPAAPRPVRRQPLRRLQRAAGNQAVQRLIQARMAISQPGDPYEVEAERVASTIMRQAGPARGRRSRPGRRPRFTPARPGVVRPKRCPCGGEAGPDGECPACRAKRLGRQRQMPAGRAPPARIMPALTAPGWPAHPRAPARGGCPGCNQKKRGPPARLPPSLLPARAANERAPPGKVAIPHRWVQRACPAGGRKRPRRTRSDDERRDILPMAGDGSGATGGAPGLESTFDALPTTGQPLPAAARGFFEPRLGRDLSQVRLHTDGRAAAAARQINALAFTSGQHIYFAAGRYEPDAGRGRHLLAHELAHTIQQAEGQAAPSRAPPPIQRYSLDEFLDDASAAGEAIVGGAEEALETAEETVVAAGEAVVAAGEAALEAGQEAITWLATTTGQAALAAANQLVALLGGTITITASGIIIDIPAFQVCPAHNILLPGPALALPIPIVTGGFTIGSFVIVGSLSANLTLVSLLSLLFGPCLLGPVRVVINPLSSLYAVSGQFSAQAGATLSANAAQMLIGQVTVIVMLPGGAIVVPAAALEAGLQETLVAQGSGLLTVPAALVYSAGTISFSLNPRLDLATSLFFQAAAAARLLLLGREMCSLVWPFFQYSLDAGATLGLNLSLGYSPGSGLSVGVVPSASGFSFSSLTSGFSAFLPQANCEGLDPIVRWLCLSGLIPPSPCVGAAPAPRPVGTTCPIGPPHAPDVRDPGIPGGALCRGACGYDCPITCQKLGDETIIVPTAAGDYYICTYRNVIACGTHQGCRDHDACYDCCAAAGHTSILDLCHRSCDCACLLPNGASNCVTWALGGGPFDGTMRFSDPPTVIGPLPGPPPGPTPVPALPAGDCCAAAQAAGLDGTDLGGVICCNNIKHACVWHAKITAANATSRSIIAGCIGAHEAVHIDHVDCTGAAVERPAFRADVNPDAGECAAYQVEVTCYNNRIDECGTDAACLADVTRELVFAIGRVTTHCGAAPPGSPGGAGPPRVAPVTVVPTDLHAFGNRTKPRDPRRGVDLTPDPDDNVGPERPPFPRGASTFGDPAKAPLTGHFHRLARGASLADGLGVVADGSEVGGPHDETHHTIYPAEKMNFDAFVAKFQGLSWAYAGKK